MLDPTRLKELVLAAFPDAALEVKDLTGTSDHYELRIVSERFRGLLPLARHRLIYGALGAHMKGDIHALALSAYTPEEWQKRA
jgi:stress-induced morphogen